MGKSIAKSYNREWSFRAFAVHLSTVSKRLNVVHVIIESGIPACMPTIVTPITFFYAAVDRFWDGYVVLG